MEKQNLYNAFSPIDYTKYTLTGWQMFNECNGTNATEMEIKIFLNEIQGKLGIEREEILNAFCNKYKAIVIGS